MPKTKCKLCGKSLVPIGRARKNGKSHNDWDTRQYHKKCWFLLPIDESSDSSIEVEYYMPEPKPAQEQVLVATIGVEPPKQKWSQIPNIPDIDSDPEPEPKPAQEQVLVALATTTIGVETPIQKWSQIPDIDSD